MRLFQIVSIQVAIVSFLLIIPSVLAEIQFYGSDIELSESGNAKVKLTITFKEPTKGFTLPIFATIKNFQATSNSGPVDCDLSIGAASIIVCKLNLTPEKRTVELGFESSDFIKTVDKNNLFNVDLSINGNISLGTVAIKLPEGYALAETSSIPAVTPPSANIISDGRRIIVNWNFNNITTDQSLKVQILYEPLKSGFPFTILIVAIVAFLSSVTGLLLLYRRSKRSKEVILSVLDDFEKKIIEIISNSGGEINQRKIVAESNLSKAKVSRVVKRLQERGLIEVIRLGRTNKIKLIRKKFEGN